MTASVRDTKHFLAAGWSSGPTSADSNETVWRHIRLLITVRDNNVDQARHALKKKLQREGVHRELKLRRHYEKPSEKRAGSMPPR